MKEILDDFSSDETLKSNLLKGKRVDLAEELSKTFYHFKTIDYCIFYLERVRHIQEKLEEFVVALNTEK